MWPILLLGGLLYVAYDTFKANRMATRTAQAFWFSTSGLSYESGGGAIQLIPATRFPATPPLAAKVAADHDHVVLLNDSSSSLDVLGGNAQNVNIQGETTAPQWDIGGLIGTRVLLLPHKVEASVNTTPPAPVWASLADGSLSPTDDVYSACQDRNGAQFIAHSGGFEEVNGATVNAPLGKHLTCFAAEKKSGIAAVVSDGFAYSVRNGRLTELRLPWQFFQAVNQIAGVAVAAHDRQIWVAVNHPGSAGSMILAFAPNGDYLGKVLSATDHIERMFGVVGDSCPPKTVLDALRQGN